MKTDCKTIVYGAVAAGNAERKFSYATYFESNMVLQMAPARAAVWGYAESSAIGETVVVSLSSRIGVRRYIANIVPGKQGC